MPFVLRVSGCAPCLRNLMMRSNGMRLHLCALEQGLRRAPTGNSDTAGRWVSSPRLRP